MFLSKYIDSLKVAFNYVLHEPVRGDLTNHVVLY